MIHKEPTKMPKTEKSVDTIGNLADVGQVQRDIPVS